MNVSAPADASTLRSSVPSVLASRRLGKSQECNHDIDKTDTTNPRLAPIQVDKNLDLNVTIDLHNTFSMEKFSYPFDSQDIQSIDAYARDLSRVRDKALEMPLVPGCTFSFVISPPKSPSHTVSTRPLPWFAKHTESAVSCELERPLKTGVDNWSQVWVARVMSPPGTDVDPIPASVVLKFIQPSMLPIPCSMSVRMADYKIPEAVVKKEAFIYAKLQALQGDVIPYFFGMQTIVTPSGESAWVLLLEHIDGPTFRDYFELIKKQDGWETNSVVFNNVCKIYKSALEGSWEIYKHSVFYVDMSDNNIILLGDRVVFIDFAQSLYKFGRGSANISADLVRLNGIIIEALTFEFSIRLEDWVVNLLDPDLRITYLATRHFPEDDPSEAESQSISLVLS